MKHQKHILIYFVAICIFIFPLFVKAEKTQYVKEISEKVIDYGYSSSFTLDNDDNPHIFYVRRPGNFIEYSYFSKNGWQRFPQPVVLNGSSPKIKIGKNNVPQGVYLKYVYNGFPCVLQYMRLSKDKKVWFKDDLNYFQFDEECPQSIDFALDSQDKPHAAYINRKDNTLFYVKKVGKFWKLKKIAGASKDSPLVFKIDSNNNFHFVYLTNNKIKYAFYNSEDKRTKTKTIYQNDKDFTDLPKIAMTIDSRSRPHIVYIVPKLNIARYSELEHVFLRNQKIIKRLKVDSALSVFYNDSLSFLPLSILSRNNSVFILYNLDPIVNSASYIPFAKSMIAKLFYPSQRYKTKFINTLPFGSSFEMAFGKNKTLHIVNSGLKNDDNGLVVYKKFKF